MHEVNVEVVGLDAVTLRPVLVLRELAPEHRVLSVWVGIDEAQAIELERQHIPTDRQQTHHLIAKVIAFCGRRLERVQVVGVQDGMTCAELVIADDLQVSDAVAVARHAQVPILVADCVLDAAAEPGLDLPVEEEAAIAELRQALDRATPDDFGRPC